MLVQRGFQRLEALSAHLVHASAEHLVDEVFLAAEVVVHRRDVDVGAPGDLAQRCARKAVLGEQLLRRSQDAVLGGELGVGRHGGILNQRDQQGCAKMNQTLVWMLGARAAAVKFNPDACIAHADFR